MNILVTGGAGFIGSHVVDQYIQAGHRVWVIDNESTGLKKNINPRARYVKIDITSKARLSHYFKGKRFDVINHHAAQIDVRKSVLDPSYDAAINIFGLLNLLALARQAKVKKVIFSSSGGTIYGECHRPAREGDPEVPLSPYGVSKLASEKYIQAYAALFGIKFTIFRYANVFGPRQDPYGEAGVVAIFSNKILKNDPAFIYGNGYQTRDFVFVHDVARANLLALQKANNCVLNIGTGRESSVRGLFKVMADISGYKLKPVFKPARVGELQRSVLNFADAKKTMGWTPLNSLHAGLEQTMQFFRDQKS